MKDYAACFRDIFQPEQCNQNVGKAFGIDRINVVIFGLRNSTIISYVLYIAKNVSDETERNKIYGILESYIMRRIVTRATTKNYNRLFASLLKNKVTDASALLTTLKKNADSTTYVPSDEELYDGFKTSKLINLQSKGIIYLLESSIRPANSSTALLGFNNYSLEHLMPKKWRNNWSPCDTNEQAEKRDSHLLTLGNLAIITQSLNASIRDASWDVKKKGKGYKLGLDKCAGGLITLQDVLKKDAWTDQDIDDRGEWLYQQAAEVWKL